MTKSKELIEFCESENNKREYSFGKELCKLSKEHDIYKIALATLKAYEQGYVLVPSAPTDEQMRAFNGEQYDHDNMIKAISVAIQDRPKTELDKILEGIE